MPQAIPTPEQSVMHKDDKPVGELSSWREIIGLLGVAGADCLEVALESVQPASRIAARWSPACYVRQIPETAIGGAGIEGKRMQNQDGMNSPDPDPLPSCDHAGGADVGATVAPTGYLLKIVWITFGYFAAAELAR